MKTEKKIRDLARMFEEKYKHILTGELSTIDINAPRALMQIDIESKVKTLYWVLGGEPYKSKLKGAK